MKKEVSVHEAKTQLSALLRQVARGQEITIVKRGVPVARLVPIPSKNNRRELGKYKGKMIVRDDFDAPLPEEMLKALKARRLTRTPKPIEIGVGDGI